MRVVFLTPINWSTQYCSKPRYVLAKTALESKDFRLTETVNFQGITCKSTV